MTTTPLDEFLGALMHSEEAPVGIFVSTEATRTELIKIIWYGQSLVMPEGALDVDGLVMSFPDPQNEGEFIEFVKLRYGKNTVIEAEGIVVCHLIG